MNSDEKKIQRVEAKLDNLNTYVVTVDVQEREDFDYFVTYAISEDEALRKVAKKLYDAEYYQGDPTFDDYLDQCLTGDLGYILDCHEPVEV